MCLFINNFFKNLYSEFKRIICTNNNVNEITNLTNFTPFLNFHLPFFTKSVRYDSYYFDENAKQSTDSRFLASSIGIFGLCRAFLVFVLLAPKDKFNEYGGREI